MADHRPLNALAAIERARAEIEIVLCADPHWRDLAQTALPVNRTAHERALAGNPVYRAWELLGRAIEEMRAGRGTGRDGAAPGAVPPQAPIHRPRVELREVLERIRGEAALDSGAALAAAIGPAPEAVSAAPRDSQPDLLWSEDDAASLPTTGSGLAPPDFEEATVTFVVREPAAPSPEPAAAPLAAEPHPPAATAGADDKEATEADVIIVKRSR